MEFNPLPDLLNNGFTIIEIGLFYGGQHLEAKICTFLIFFDKMAMSTSSRNLLSRRRVKALQYIEKEDLGGLKTQVCGTNHPVLNSTVWPEPTRMRLRYVCIPQLSSHMHAVGPRP